MLSSTELHIHLLFLFPQTPGYVANIKNYHLENILQTLLLADYQIGTVNLSTCSEGLKQFWDSVSSVIKNGVE